jgi:hypothetical protein
LFGWFSKKKPAPVETEGFKGESLVVNPPTGMTPERFAAMKVKLARMEQAYSDEMKKGMADHPAVKDLAKDIAMTKAILARYEGVI